MAGQLQMNGVRVSAIKKDDSPVRMVYEPGHPDADANGYVQMPNVSSIVEMMDMKEATKSYQANIGIYTQTRDMASKTIDLLR